MPQDGPLEWWARTGFLHTLAAGRGWPFVDALLASGVLEWLAAQAGTVDGPALNAELRARLPAAVWRRSEEHLAQRDADGPGHRCTACRLRSLN